MVFFKKKNQIPSGGRIRSWLIGQKFFHNITLTGSPANFLDSVLKGSSILLLLYKSTALKALCKILPKVLIQGTRDSPVVLRNLKHCIPNLSSFYRFYSFCNIPFLQWVHMKSHSNKKHLASIYGWHLAK